MELSQWEKIQKPKMQELPALFMTDINVMHAPVKFHEYILYGLGVMARTRLTIWKQSRTDNLKTKNQRVVFLVHDILSQFDACTCKFSFIHSIRFRSYGPDTVELYGT